MDIADARGLINTALNNFLLHEMPRSTRVLIILNQLNELGFDIIPIFGARFRVLPNKDIMGALTRKQKKWERDRKRLLKRTGWNSIEG